MTDAATSTLIRFMRLPEVMKLTGLTRSTIYDMMDAGKFPRPVKIGLRANGWTEQDLIDWANARIAERDVEKRARVDDIPTPPDVISGLYV